MKGKFSWHKGFVGVYSEWQDCVHRFKPRTPPLILYRSFQDSVSNVGNSNWYFRLFVPFPTGVWGRMWNSISWSLPFHPLLKSTYHNRKSLFSLGFQQHCRHPLSFISSNSKIVLALQNKATSVMIESRHEKNCLCDLRITNPLRCQGSMIPTVPISEIPKLVQAYVDEGTDLRCFLVMQIIRHYLSWTDAIKPTLLFLNSISKGSLLETIF